MPVGLDMSTKWTRVVSDHQREGEM
jgi:hypothetical protein